MKKIKILFLLPALVLCSCGAKKNKYAGTYQFRMGKTDENHMEVTATITDEEDSKVKGYKIMNVTADLGDEFDPKQLLDQLEGVTATLESYFDVDDINTLIGALRTELDGLVNIPLYYKVTDYSLETHGYRLEIGTHFVADLFETIEQKQPSLSGLLSSLKSFTIGTGFVDKNLYLKPEISKYFFNAFINKKALTFQIPVSLDDLKYQMFWYGMDYEGLILHPDVEMDKGYVASMPGEQGEKRFGTHPKLTKENNKVVKDEVAEVNGAFEYQFSKSPLFANDTPGDFTEKGRFVLEDINGQKQLRIKDIQGPLSGVVTGYVGFDRHPIKLNLDENGVCQITSDGKKGSAEGFVDLDGNPFVFFNLVSDPFEFRDFNIVDVGLSKVEA